MMNILYLRLGQGKLTTHFEHPNRLAPFIELFSEPLLSGPRSKSKYKTSFMSKTSRLDLSPYRSPPV